MAGFDKTVPTAGNNWQTDMTAMRSNAEWTERALLMLGYFMITGHEINYTYTGDKITAISVKDISLVEVASATLAYTGDELTTEAWVINGKTLTYTYTWSSGKITKVKLAVT